MKPLGSDGRPIPTPPDQESWRDVLATIGKNGLRTGASFLVVGLVTALISYKTWLAKGWSEIAWALLRAVGIFLGGGVALVAATSLLGLVFWPLMRKSSGYKLERAIDRLSPEELAQAIEDARRSMRDAQDARIGRGWADWLEWLQARAAKRQVISRAPLSWSGRPDPRSLIVVSLIGALFAGFGVWAAVTMALQQPDPWLFVFPLGMGGFGAYIYGQVATQRIELTPDRLGFYKFWRPVWSISREHAVVGEDPEAYPSAYRVFDRTTQKSVGVIVASPFRVDDLEALADWFPFPPEAGR